MENIRTFGNYLQELRMTHSRTKVDMIRHLGVDPVSYCDVERDLREAFENFILVRIVQYLCLDETEQKTLYDLAAESRKREYKNLIPRNNKPEYLYSTVHLAPWADDKSVDEWQQMVDDLRRRKGELID